MRRGCEANAVMASMCWSGVNLLQSGWMATRQSSAPSLFQRLVGGFKIAVT